MSDLEWPQHRNADNRVYGINWTAFLAKTGEAIATSTWGLASGSGAPINVGGDQGLVGTAQTYVRLASGVPGVIYTFSNTITTTSGNVTQLTVDLPVAPV